MSKANPEPSFDLAATAVRAFVLYSLMEFQTGTATTIRVTKQGSAFSITDDGRGHPLDKELEGTSYLRFVYTHFDYPFESRQASPIQLQGIGMSLVNAMCSELLLTVRKQSETLTVRFVDGRASNTHRVATSHQQSGIEVQARLREALPFCGAQDRALEAWLQGLAELHPTLRLYFNGRQLKGDGTGDAKPFGRASP